MKYLVALLMVAAAALSQGQSVVSPLAGGIPQVEQGILEGVPNEGPMVGRCVIGTKCHDSTCTTSPSADSTKPGPNPPAAFIQHTETRVCADRLPTIQDTLYTFMLLDMRESKWKHLDSVKQVATDSGRFISYIGAFTPEDSARLWNRAPIAGRIISGIRFEEVECSACAE